MNRSAQVPDGWNVARLGDVAEVVGGSTPSRSRKEFWEGDVPWVVPSELTNLKGRYLTATKEAITDAGLQSAGLKLIPSGSVLLTTRATIGVTAINAIPVTTNQGFQNIIVKNGIDPLWLFYGVSSMRRELEKRAAGSTFLEVSRDSVRSLPLLLPSLTEQRAIAAVLDSIDEAIECTEAVIAATERLRDALLHELLTRGVPGWHSEWKEVPGIGTIPACWDVARLGDVAGFVTSGSRAWSKYFRPDGALFVRSQNISAGTIDTSDVVFVQPPEDTEGLRTRIHMGDLLISITGEPGKVTVADDMLGQAYVSQHVALVRLNNRDLSAFVGEYLRGRAGQNQFRGMAYGQTRPGLGLTNVNNANVAIPSPSERNMIANVGRALDEAIKENRSEHDRLQSLKVSTADALLVGRTRVR